MIRCGYIRKKHIFTYSLLMFVRLFLILHSVSSKLLSNVMDTSVAVLFVDSFSLCLLPLPCPFSETDHRRLASRVVEQQISCRGGNSGIVLSTPRVRIFPPLARTAGIKFGDRSGYDFPRVSGDRYDAVHGQNWRNGV